MRALDWALNFDEVVWKKSPFAAFWLRPNATTDLAKSILSLILLGVISDFRNMKLKIRNAADKCFGLG